MKKLSFQIAFGGIATAFCIVFMLLAGIIPLTEYAAPMLCGMVIYIVSYECGVKMALTAFAAVSVLCVLLSPNKESALMFAGFFGYFPLLGDFLDRRCQKFVRFVVRHAVFNIAMVASYWLLSKVFGIAAIEEFNGIALILLALGNLILPLYCIWYRIIMKLYENKLRKKLFRRK